MRARIGRKTRCWLLLARASSRLSRESEALAAGRGRRLWITSGGLPLGAPPAHILGHHGVITDLQLGVIHRPETS
jgi:hypothetical protein